MISLCKIPAEYMERGNFFVTLDFVFWIENDGQVCYQEVRDRKEANCVRRQLEKRGVQYINIREQRVGRS